MVLSHDISATLTTLLARGARTTFNYIGDTSIGYNRGTEIMARTLQHNRSSYTLDTGTRGTSGTVSCGKAEKRFTASEVEYSVLKALEPVLLAREGTVYSFADWTMAGNGIVVVLANGQEFRMEIVEAV